mgnify:CR=1 FL=1
MRNRSRSVVRHPLFAILFPSSAAATLNCSSSSDDAGPTTDAALDAKDPNADARVHPARSGTGTSHTPEAHPFGTANLTRLAGAQVSTLDRPTIDGLAGVALDINPEAELVRCPMGVGADRIDACLEGLSTRFQDSAPPAPRAPKPAGRRRLTATIN